MIRVAAILVYALTACLLPSNSAVGSENCNMNRLQVFSTDPFENPIGHSLVLGNARERIEERFGDPQDLQSWQEDDRTSEGKLILSKFVYSGMTIVFGEGEDRTRSWIESIELTAGHPTLKFGLGTGVSADVVVAAFDPAGAVRSGDDLRLETTIHEDLDDVSVESHVELTFELDADGAVKKILIRTIAL